MSLINQMLTDLEARRGGTLRSVDHALDGLQSAPIATRARPRRGPRRLWLGAGMLVLVAALAAGVFWWWRAQDRASPPTLPDLAPPSAETAVVPPPPAQGTPVILADKPAPAPELPAVPPKAEAPATAPTSSAVSAQPPSSPPPPQGGSASMPELVQGAPQQAPATGPGLPATPASAPPQSPSAALQAQSQAGGSPPVEMPGAFHRAETAQGVDPDAMAYQQALREAEDGSLGALATFVTSRPKRFDARQRLALAQIKAADRVSAEATLRDGLALRPNDPTLARLLGHLLLGANQVESALEVLRAATPPVAKDTEFHALLAAAEQRTGAHAMAAARYKSLLQIQPTNGSWQVGLGISVAALGDARSAARLFNQALDDRSLPEPLRSYASRERLRLEEHLK